MYNVEPCYEIYTKDNQDETKQDIGRSWKVKWRKERKEFYFTLSDFGNNHYYTPFVHLVIDGILDGGGRSDSNVSGDLPLEIHYIVIIGVIGLLILIVAIDMMCFCCNDFGILACICGNVGQRKGRGRGEDLYLDGGE